MSRVNIDRRTRQLIKQDARQIAAEAAAMTCWLDSRGQKVFLTDPDGLRGLARAYKAFIENDFEPMLMQLPEAEGRSLYDGGPVAPPHAKYWIACGIDADSRFTYCTNWSACFGMPDEEERAMVELHCFERLAAECNAAGTPRGFA